MLVEVYTALMYIAFLCFFGTMFFKEQRMILSATSMVLFFYLAFTSGSMIAI